MIIGGHMKAYAVAHIREIRMGPPIVEYLEKIDATLEPFSGRFIVHGGEKIPLEGSWPGDLIVIEFPSRDAAKSWYNSDNYRAILPLRTDNSVADTIIVSGVDQGHKATDILS
jgi:uncharacterized protein (DUF1330 family)